MSLDAGKCLMLFDDAAYYIRGARDGRIGAREFADVTSLNKLQLYAAADCVYYDRKS